MANDNNSTIEFQLRTGDGQEFWISEDKFKASLSDLKSYSDITLRMKDAKGVRHDVPLADYAKRTGEGLKPFMMRRTQVTAKPKKLAYSPGWMAKGTNPDGSERQKPSWEQTAAEQLIASKQKAEKAVVDAATAPIRKHKEEEERRAQRIPLTGDPEVDENIYITKTQGEVEDALMASSDRLAEELVQNATYYKDSKGKYIELTNAQSIANRLNESLAQWANDPNVKKRILAEADAAGVDRDTYYNLVVENASQMFTGKLIDSQVAKRMPKDDLDYLVSGIKDSIGGLIYNIIKPSEGEIGAQINATVEQRAQEEFGRKYTLEILGHEVSPLNLGRTAVTFAADAPFFGLSGKVSNAVVKKVAQREVANMVKKGVARKVAESIVFGKLKQSIVQGGAKKAIKGMAVRTGNAMIGGAANLGTYNLMSGTARQASERKFEPGKLVMETIDGAIQGAMLGLSGKVMSRAVGGTTTKFGTVTANASKFLVEAGVFSTVGEAQNAVKARLAEQMVNAGVFTTQEEANEYFEVTDGEINPVEDFITSVEQLAVMKTASWHTVRHPQKTLRSLWTPHTSMAYTGANGREVLSTTMKNMPESYVENVKKAQAKLSKTTPGTPEHAKAKAELEKAHNEYSQAYAEATSGVYTSFTNDEIQHLKGNRRATALTESQERLMKAQQTLANTKEGTPEHTNAKNEAEAAKAAYKKAYSDFMNDKELTYAEKQKTMFVMTGQVNVNKPVMMGARIDGNLVTTKDNDGNTIERHQFKTEDEAMLYYANLKKTFDRNMAYMMAQENPEAHQMAMDYMLIHSGYSEEEITTAMKGQAADGMQAAKNDAIMAQYIAALDAYADTGAEYSPQIQRMKGKMITAGERHTAMVEMNAALDALSDGTPAGEAYRRQVEQGKENPADALYQMAMTGATEEQIAAATRYYNAVEKVNGMMEGAKGDIDSQVEEANNQVIGNAYQEEGGNTRLITATDRMGNGYFVLSGRFDYNRMNGNPVKEDCDQSIVVRNLATGELEVKSPADLRVVRDDLVEDLINTNETTLRENLIDGIDNEITYAKGTPEQGAVGDTYVGADGKTYQIQVDERNGQLIKIEVETDEAGQLKAKRNVPAQPFDITEYRDSKSAELDATHKQQMEAERQAKIEARRQAEEAERQAAEEERRALEGETATSEEAPHSALNEENTDGNSGAEPETEKQNGLTAEQLQEVSDREGNVTEITMSDGTTGYWYRGNLNDEAGRFTLATFDETGKVKTEERNVSDILKTETGDKAVRTYNPREESAIAEAEARDEAARKAEEARQQAIAEAKKQQLLKQRQENFLNDWVKGYREGNPDILHKETRPDAAAEYLIKKNGGDVEKAKAEAQSMYDSLSKEYDSKTEEIEKLRQQQKLWGNAMNATDAQQNTWALERAIEDKNRAERNRNKMELINEEFMTPEEKVASQEARRQRIIQAQEEARINAERQAAEREAARKEAEEAQRQTEEAAIHQMAEEARKAAEENPEEAAKWDEVQKKVDEAYNKRHDKLDKARTPEEKLKAAQEVYAQYPEALLYFDDMEPQTAYEYVSQMGSHQLSWEGYDVNGRHVKGVQEHVFGKTAKRGVGKNFDTNGINHFLAPKGQGVGIEEMAHKLWEACDGRWDIDEIQDALIDMLSSTESVQQTRNMIVDARIEEAEKIARVMDEQGAEYEVFGEVKWSRNVPSVKDGVVKDENGKVRFSKSTPTAAKAYVESEYAGKEREHMADEAKDLKAEYDALEQRTRQIAEMMNDYVNGESDLTAEAVDGLLQESGRIEARMNEIEREVKAVNALMDKLPEGSSELGAETGEGAEKPAESEQYETSQQELEAEKEKVDTNPSEAQKEAGNYKKGHIDANGLKITIENPKGSERSGVDANGHEWSQPMEFSYGYVRGHEGADGDHLDMFVNDAADLWHWNGNVYIVDQMYDDGTFDEHKVMYGFDSMEAARSAYLGSYEPGWESHIKDITEVKNEDFRKWLDSGEHDKPFTETGYGKVVVAQKYYEQLKELQEKNKNADIIAQTAIRHQINEVRKQLQSMHAYVPPMEGEMHLLDEGLGAIIKTACPDVAIMLEAVGKQTGLKVRIISEQQAKLEEAAMTGEMPRSASNGWNDLNGTITINVEAKDITPNGIKEADRFKLGQQILKAVFGHEMNHTFFNQTPELKKMFGTIIEKYYDYAKQHNKNVKDYDDTFKKKKDDYAQQLEGKSEEEIKEYIHEEMAGDLVGEQMLDVEFVQEMLKEGELANDEGMLATMARAYRDFKRKYRGFFDTEGKRKKKGFLTREEQMNFNAVQDLIIKAYREAVKKNAKKDNGTGTPSVKFSNGEKELNRKYKGMSNEELFVSLQDDKNYSTNGVTELINRKAQISRLGNGMGEAYRQDAHAAGRIIVGTIQGVFRQGSEDRYSPYGSFRQTETKRAVDVWNSELGKAYRERETELADAENYRVEEWAQQNNCWYEQDNLKKRSYQGYENRSGFESVVYKNEDGTKAVKLTPVDRSIPNGLGERLDEIAIHNTFAREYGLDTEIEVIGYGRDMDGNLCVITEQKWVDGQSVYEMMGGDAEKCYKYIDDYLTNELGLTPHYNEDGDIDFHYTNDYIINDVNYNNVIVDAEGNNHIIDFYAELNDEPSLNGKRKYEQFGVKGGIKLSKSATDEDLAKRQAEIINAHNPAEDDIHTWIRNAEDVMTYGDAVKMYGAGDEAPDFTAADKARALETGEITVYSSKPIEQGAFVTPSKMEAQTYAGTTDVHEATVRLEDVAWIDPMQGQYAKVESDITRPINIETADGSTVKAEGGNVRFSYASRQAEQQLLDAVYNTNEGKWVKEELEDMKKVGDAMMEGVVGLMAQHPAFENWNQRIAIVDKNGNPVYSVFRNNHDTQAPTIELSRNCVKKEAMNNLLTILRREGNLQKLDNISYLDLREILKKHGYAIACEMCYVESKRENVEAKQRLAKEWNEIAKKAGFNTEYFMKTGGTAELTEKQKNYLNNLYHKNGQNRTAKIAALMIDYPELRGAMDYTAMYTPEGWNELLTKFGDSHRFMNWLSSHDGSSTATPTYGSQAFSQERFMQEYGELSRWFGEQGIKFGGFRKHSYSDADPLLFVDDFQIHENLALTKSGMFGYTKVPYYVDMWGETGEFINQSLVVDIDTTLPEAERKKYAGLIRVGDPRHQKGLGMTDEEYAAYKRENGLQDGDWDYYYAEESFPVKQAMAFRMDPRFGGRVGNVIVSTSDEMTRRALDDPRIDVIIGYHSTNKMINAKQRTGYEYAKDHAGSGKKKANNETRGNTGLTSTTYLPSMKVIAPTFVEGQGKKAKVKFNYNEACQQFGDAKKAAQAYLEWCDVNGYTPMYDQFRDHENYYKLLNDFRRYDNEGNPLMMKPIELNLPKNWAEKLDSYLSEREAEYAKNTSEMEQNTAFLDDVHKALGVKFSKTAPNGEPSNLNDKQHEQVRTDNFKKYFGDWEGDPEHASKVVDENGEPLVVYHGTQHEEMYVKDGHLYTRYTDPFTVFKDGKGFFTDDKAAAETFARGKQGLYATYLNMRNPYIFECNGSDWDALKGYENPDGYTMVTTDYIVNDIKNNHPEYDGVIFKNVMNENSGTIRRPINDYIPFKAEQIKSAETEGPRVNNGSFDGKNPDIRFSKAVASADPFYSNAAKAVEGIKQEKATPEQWLKMIEKAGGLKKGEDKWMGLSEWLKGYEGKTVTRQEVMDFIQKNAIKVEEVHYAEELPMSQELQDKVEELWQQAEGNNYDKAEWVTDQLVEEYGDDLRIAGSVWYDGLFHIDDQEAYGSIFGMGEYPIEDVRLEYTTEGLENKKEIALTVPTIAPYNIADPVHFGDAGGGRAVAWVRFGDAESWDEEHTKAKRAVEDFGKQMMEKYGTDQFETVDKLNAEEKATYDQLIDRLKAAEQTQGSKVLVIDEIQSKRHQDGREKGYISKEAKDSILTQRESITRRMDEIIAERESIKPSVNLIPNSYHVKKNTDLWGNENWIIEVMGKDNSRTTFHLPIDTVITDEIVRREAEELMTEFDNGPLKKIIDQAISQEDQRRLDELSEEYRTLQATDMSLTRPVLPKTGAVPDAPFDKNWMELAVKRMLRYAAENGYDKVAWTTGQQQSDRYNIGDIVDRVDVSDWDMSEDYNGKVKVANVEIGAYDVEMVFDENGIVKSVDVSDFSDMEGKKLSEIFGKEMADTMMEDGVIGFDAENISVGAEGMKGFYDKMIPQFMQKYGKKWGAKVGEVELDLPRSADQKMWSVDVTPEMKESVMQGQPMFSKGGSGNAPEYEEFLRYNYPDRQESWYKSQARRIDKWLNGRSEWLSETDMQDMLNRINKGEQIVTGKYAGQVLSEVMTRVNRKYPEASHPIQKYPDKYGNASISQLEYIADRKLPYIETMMTEVGKVWKAAADAETRHECMGFLMELGQAHDYYEAMRDEVYGDMYEGNEGVHAQKWRYMDRPRFSKANTDDARNYADDLKTLKGEDLAAAEAGMEAIANNVRFSIVRDQAEIDRLNAEEYEEVYHAMQVIEIDGKRYLFPPMAAVQGKDMVEGIPVNADGTITPVWEKADENPQLSFRMTVGKKGKKVPEDAVLTERIVNGEKKYFYNGEEVRSENGEPSYYFALKKGNKGDDGEKLTDLGCVAYDPYQHSGMTPVNDQFTTAYNRSHLVIVKVRVPKSEMTGESGYRADRAKLGVGTHDWTGGKLKTKNRRQVILSRWDMPIEIVSDHEVAVATKKVLDDNGLTEVPFNIVTPTQREALVAIGVKIGKPTSDTAGKKAMPAYNEWLKQQEKKTVRFSKSEIPADEAERKTYGEDIYLHASRSGKEIIREEAQRSGDALNLAEAAIKVVERIEKEGAMNPTEVSLVRFSKTPPAKVDGESQVRYNERVRNWARQNSQSADWARREAIDNITTLLDDKYLPAMNKTKLRALMNAVRFASPERAEQTLHRAQQIIREMKTKTQQRHIDMLLGLKTQDVNSRNISIAKNVSEDVRVIMGMLQGRMVDLKTSGYEEDMTQLRRDMRLMREENTKLQGQIDRGILPKAEEDEAIRKIKSNNERIEQAKEELKDLAQRKHEVEQMKLQQADLDVDEAIRLLDEKMDAYVEGKGEFTHSDRQQYVAMQILKLQQEVKKLRQQADTIRRQANSSENPLDQMLNPEDAQNAAVARNWRARNELLASIEEEIDSRQTDIIDQLEQLISSGKANLKFRVEEELQRKKSLIHNMFGDIGGKGGKDLTTLTAKERKEMGYESKWKTAFTAQLGSFEYMAQRIARNSVGKDSWFYRHFILGKEGVIEARNTYLRGMKEATDRMDEKCREIYGTDLDGAVKRNSKETTTDITLAHEVNGIEVHEPLTLTKAQATYLYMVWKMADGRCKMVEQGFDEASMAKIEEFIGPENIEWADWVQDEYLADLREKYNQKHIEMFNTSMANIEHYVPLRIDKTEIKSESDLENGGNSQKGKSLSERAGSLINRTHNTLPVDVTASAFEVVMSHVNQMEEFNAFARVRRDLDYILSSTGVRNQLNANVHGQYSDLLESAAIATHCDHQEPAKFGDSFVSAMTKGLVSGNIAFRYTTALKQMLSVPAFYGYSQDPRFIAALTKNIGVQYIGNAPALIATMLSGGYAGKKAFKAAAGGKKFTAMTNTVNWCAKNLPGFADRIAKGTAGHYELDDASLGKFLDGVADYGMAANQMVDAITCAIGIKTIYDYRMAREKARIKKLDLSEAEEKKALDEAHRMALMEADVYYNGTQQSNDAAFLSPMQKSRTLLNRSLSVYQNASIGFSRKLASAVNDLHVLDKWGTYKQRLIEQGYTEKEANKHLAGQVWKAAVNIAMYGFITNILWDQGSKGFLGMFQSNDDEENVYNMFGVDDNMGGLRDYAEWISYPMRGQPGMNILSSLAMGNLKSPLLVYDLLGDMTTEAKKTIEDHGLISIPMTSLIMGRALRMGGIDTRVMTNAYLGIEHAIKAGVISDKKYTGRMLDLMFVLNTPNSNRLEVAKKLYKDMPAEQFATEVLRASKYLDEADEEWASLNFITGMKTLTKNREAQLYKELATLQLTPEELKKVLDENAANKDIKTFVSQCKELSDLYDAFDNETDATKKKKLADAIHNNLKSKSFTRMTKAERMAEARKNLLGEEASTEEKPNTTYLRQAKSSDIVQDAIMKEAIDKLKDIYDEYESIEDSQEQYTFYMQNAKTVDLYSTLKDANTTINSLKKDLKDAAPEERESIMQEIRKTRKEALGDAK